MQELIERAIKTRFALRAGDVIVSPKRVPKSLNLNWELWSLEQCESYLRRKARKDVDEQIKILMEDLYPEIHEIMSYRYIEVTSQEIRLTMRKLGLINPNMTLAELSKEINKDIFWIMEKL